MVVMPKRRKSKDNPYTLSYSEEKHTYILSFKDGKNINREVELTEELYETFNKFELEDISIMHKIDKHIEHFELQEEVLYKRAVKKIDTVEKLVEDNITSADLKKAIDELSPVQKRRIKMYFFEDLTLEEISKIEECSFQAISKSISLAIEKLQKNLKN